MVNIINLHWKFFVILLIVIILVRMNNLKDGFSVPDLRFLLFMFV